MSKSTDNVLLVPGETGWEIWTGPSAGPFALHAATTVELAGELTDVPNGDIFLLFPVKAITALPVKVASNDEALFPDLAALHLERLGLRPDPMAGQLTDVFPISREEENASIVSLMLRAPGDGEMPTRGPKGFDLSARAFRVNGDALVLWKEFGRWVFAVFNQSHFVYCQATACDSASPDAILAREIRLSLIQLAMQGLAIDPQEIHVWSAGPDQDGKALFDDFRRPVHFAPRPAPSLPTPLSKLLPADVRAARRAAQKRRNIILAVSTVAAAYVGLLGWFGYGLWKDIKETKKLAVLAKEAEPEGQAYAMHIAKWDELNKAIEISNSPVEILHRISNCIIPNSGLRLKTADISADSVKLIGEAGVIEVANTFSLKLSKSTELTQFKWELPPSSQSARGWEFVYSGEVSQP